MAELSQSDSLGQQNWSDIARPALSMQFCEYVQKKRDIQKCMFQPCVKVKLHCPFFSLPVKCFEESPVSFFTLTQGLIQGWSLAGVKKKLLFKLLSWSRGQRSKSSVISVNFNLIFERFHSEYLSGLHAFCIYSFQHLGTNPQIEDGFWMNWCLFICSLKKNTFSNKICFGPKFKHKSQRAASDNNFHQKLTTKSHICVAAKRKKREKIVLQN